MQRVPSDQAKNFPVPIWDTYQQIVDAAEGKPVSSRKEGTFVVRKETWHLMSTETIQLIRDRQIVDAAEGKKRWNFCCKEGTICPQKPYSLLGMGFVMLYLQFL